MRMLSLMFLSLFGLTSGQSCTANGQDCRESKCCSESGMTCYKKNDDWASCNETCDPYKYWNTTTNQFEVHENPQWTCEKLSEPVSCTANGQDCRESKCCSESGMTCFKKNDGWASCNETCDPYKYWNTTTNQFEVHENPQWTCEVLTQAANATANATNETEETEETNETITATGTATATATAAASTTPSGGDVLPGEGTGTPGASMPNNVAAAKAAQLAQTQDVKANILNDHSEGKHVSSKLSAWSPAGTSMIAVMLVVLVVGVSKWRSRSASSTPEQNLDEVSLFNEQAIE